MCSSGAAQMAAATVAAALAAAAACSSCWWLLHGLLPGPFGSTWAPCQRPHGQLCQRGGPGFVQLSRHIGRLAAMVAATAVSVNGCIAGCRSAAVQAAAGGMGVQGGRCVCAESISQSVEEQKQGRQCGLCHRPNGLIQGQRASSFLVCLVAGLLSCVHVQMKYFSAKPVLHRLCIAHLSRLDSQSACEARSGGANLCHPAC